MDLLNLFKNYLFSQADKPSKVTVKNYLSDINHFVRWYENIFTKSFDAKKVSGQTLQDYRNNCSTVFSPSSLDRHFSTLRKFFKFLLIEGVISLDPFSVKKLALEANKDPWHVKDFKDFLYVGDASRLTIKNYLIDIKQFLAWAAQVTETNNVLPAIDSNLVEEYKQRLLNQGDFSPATINRKLSSLRKYLAWAQSQTLVSSISYQIPGIEKQVAPIVDILEPKVEEAKAKYQIQNTKYSLFPPIRLTQKLSEAFIFALDNSLIIHLAKIADRAEYAIWKTQGQPVFTKITDLRLKIKDRKSSIGITHSLLNVKNIKKEFYAPLEISTKLFPWYKKAWFTARYSRPKWYKTYHSYPIVHYLNFAVLIIFLGVISVSFYNVFFQKGNQSPTLAVGTPVAPPRVLSFQGRLTDNNDNPITTITNLRFGIYSSLSATDSASTAIFPWQEVNSVTPDQDGIFNVILGNNTTIPSTLFSQNAALWLGITVGTTPELTPRQQLATVAYATNAETLQGLVPTTSGPTAYTNTVLALDGTAGSPTLTIGGSVGTTFQATGGQFQILGKSLLLGSTAGSGGNVAIAPDGLGFIDLRRPLINTTNTGNITGILGAVEIDDMLGVLATSSGAGVTIQQNGSGDLLTASAGANTKFTVTNTGFLLPGTTNAQDIGSSSLQWRNIYAQNVYSSGGLLAQFWQRYGNALSPTTLTDDFLLGGSTTDSAKFAFTGLLGNQTQASFSGQLIVMPDVGYGGGIQFGSTINNNNVLNTLAATGAPSGNLYWGNRQLIDSTTIGGYGVTSVTNSDSTLTISPTTGAVIASLNTTHANSWTGAQTFTTSTNFPNGIWNSIGNVGIGTTAIGNGELVVNQPNANGDIFSASVSGSTKFKVDNTGALTSAAYNNAGGLLYTSTTGLIGQTGIGTVAQCLIGGATPGWASCSSAAGGSFWQDLNGAISPLTSSDDLLLGGSSTASAVFAFTGLMGNQTQASFSGQFIVMPNNGYGGNVGIGTTSPQATLDSRGNARFGNSTTTSTTGISNQYVLLQSDTNLDSIGYNLSIDNTRGNRGWMKLTDSASISIMDIGMTYTTGTDQAITFSVAGGEKLRIDSSGNLTATGTLTGLTGLTLSSGPITLGASTGSGQCLTGGATASWGSCGASGASSPFAEILGVNGGVIVPNNSTEDLLIGGQSTASAKFAFLNSNLARGNQVASISGSITLDAAGAIQTTNNQLLTIGGNTTGNITLTPNDGTGGVINLNAPTINTNATTLALFNATTTTLNFAGAATTLNLGAPSGSASISATLTLGGNTSSTINPGNGTLNFGYKSGANTWGTAMTILDNTGNVGIGTATPLVILDVRGNSGTLSIASFSGTTSFAALVANNDGVGDLFTASASGWTRFIVSNTGSLTSAAYTNAGGVLYTSTTGLIGQTGVGTGTQCLIGGVTPTWSSCATAASNFWQRNSGALSPLTSSDDLLLGSNATASAIFAFTGLMGNQTQASFSGQFIVMPNNGYGGNASISGNLTLGAFAASSIQTTAFNALTLGGTTTGNITLSPFNSALGANVTPGITNQVDL